MRCDTDLRYTFWTLKMKMRLDGMWYGFVIGILDSGNQKEAKLIRTEPIWISFGTSGGDNPESLLVIFYKLWNKALLWVLLYFYIPDEKFIARWNREVTSKFKCHPSLK
jgi:hypothetical protein